MSLNDILIAVSGILITSLPIVLVRVNFKRFGNDGSNEFIHMMLSTICLIIQIDFWKILIYGMDVYRADRDFMNWWITAAVVAYTLFVLVPIRKKIYPGSKIGLIDMIRDEIKEKKKKRDHKETQT